MRNNKKVYPAVFAVLLILSVFMLWSLNTVSAEEAQDHEHGGQEKHAVHDDKHGEHGDDKHDEHSGGHNDGHGEGHGGHGEEDEIKIDGQEMNEFAIKVAKAAPGLLDITVELPGEIMINPDRIAHVVPRSTGVVKMVQKSLGDRVYAGEVLAVLESAELGEARISFFAEQMELEIVRTDLKRAETIYENTRLLLDLLGSEPDVETVIKKTEGLDMGKNKSRLVSAYAGLQFTKEVYLREKGLYDKKISSQADFLGAKSNYKNAQAEFATVYDEVTFSIKRELLDQRRTVSVAEAALLAAERRLHILGLTDADLAKLKNDESYDLNIASVEIRSPIDGTVIEKHITLGEVLQDDAAAFVVANLNSVWASFNVYQKHLPLLRKGQLVNISGGGETSSSKIFYIDPVINKTTRTVVARAILDNKKGHWRPGMFINSNVVIDRLAVPILVSRSALQTVEEKVSVFVKTGDGFKVQPVEIGKASITDVEVTSGLIKGQTYVTEGTFTLKAQIGKGSFGDGHNH